jgi:hypothetical protein
VASISRRAHRDVHDDRRSTQNIRNRIPGEANATSSKRVCNRDVSQPHWLQ